MPAFYTLLPSSSAADAPDTVVSDKVKGFAYYVGRNDISTGTYSVGTGFVGNIVLQGTLVENPTADEEWVEITESVYTNLVTPLVAPYVNVFNFKGNFTWIRAVVTLYTGGSISYVRLGY